MDEEQPKPHILVKCLTDKTVKVDWSDSLTVGQVREHLKEKQGKLIYQGAVLDDEQRLKDIVPASTADFVPVIYVFHYNTLGIDPIEAAKDWDQKNRLRFFKGLYDLSCRRFAEGGKLLVESLPTFTETGMIAYKDCVRYAIIAACLTFERPAIGKLIKAPEVIEVADRMPQVRDLLWAFYQCRYAEVLAALAAVEGELARDWLLAPHTQYIVKEMRVRAYQQILRSYKSVSLQSMADAFGVTVPFIDRYAAIFFILLCPRRELSRFIAAGRLHAVIDQVGGQVITSAADVKDVEYGDLVKQADHLLNRIQKLSRVVTY